MNGRLQLPFSKKTARIQALSRAQREKARHFEKPGTKGRTCFLTDAPKLHFNLLLSGSAMRKRPQRERNASHRTPDTCAARSETSICSQAAELLHRGVGLGAAVLKSQRPLDSPKDLCLVWPTGIGRIHTIG